MPRKLLSDINNYQVFEPSLVEDFSGAPDNDPQTAYTIETTDVKTGTASARLSSPASPSFMDYYFTGKRITESGIGIWFKKPEGATWTSFVLFLADDNGAFGLNHWAQVNVTSTDGAEVTSGADQRTGWNFKILYPEDFAPSGTFKVGEALINTARIRHSFSGVGDVVVDSINFDIRARAKCMIMADDSHDTFWTLGKPLLDAAGFPATIYQTHGLIDQANYATSAQLRSAYTNDGWDICNHLDVHQAITNTVTGITKASNAVVTITATPNPTIGEEMTLVDVEGMTEINGLTGTVVGFDGAGKTITLDIDSTDFTTYTAAGKLRYSDQQLTAKLDVMDNWLLTEGMHRSRLHFAYPTGVFDVEHHPAFMENYGFKTSRSIHSTLINHHVLGVDNMQHLWARGVGVSVSAADVIAKIDEAILKGGTVGIYLHALTTGTPVESDYFWALTKFQTVIDYLVLKVRLGEIDMTTISKWDNGL